LQKKEQQQLIERIKSIAKEAHIVSFNGQIVASRTNVTGREFAVVAGVMTSITKELESVVSAFVKKTASA
jgi:methyl-accepting chemotaxis protein